MRREALCTLLIAGSILCTGYAKDIAEQNPVKPNITVSDTRDKQGIGTVTKTYDYDVDGLVDKQVREIYQKHFRTGNICLARVSTENYKYDAQKKKILTLSTERDLATKCLEKITEDHRTRRTMTYHYKLDKDHDSILESSEEKIVEGKRETWTSRDNKDRITSRFILMKGKQSWDSFTEIYENKPFALSPEVKPTKIIGHFSRYDHYSKQPYIVGFLLKPRDGGYDVQEIKVKSIRNLDRRALRDIPSDKEAIAKYQKYK